MLIVTPFPNLLIPNHYRHFHHQIRKYHSLSHCQIRKYPSRRKGHPVLVMLDCGPRVWPHAECGAPAGWNLMLISKWEVGVSE